ncbi:IbrB-like domain-containing protein [Pseudomonas paraeruginosa]|uniref:IbrB-like domain-containing protein n=1 Tax=Pseudomonas paraeruginosa TaxID=2994495 RepID=UPI000CFB67C9|nr:ParB/RepB/Spo0J family partition protein [Pseudomonas paraeruginosa]
MPQTTTLAECAEALFRELDDLPLAERIETLNRIRGLLHAHSPFADQPVDCVQWVRAEQVAGNDYNPNSVAPPEMRLLRLSIEADGFTQPIVAYPQADGRFEVVDGFHRLRVGSGKGLRQRLHGYLPLASIRPSRTGGSERIAATIRHNRARGVHGVLPMTAIVVSLLRAGWSEADVARELGMDNDEVLRFKQVSGLPEMFRDHEYSRSWE